MYAIVEQAARALLCQPIGHMPALQAIPLHILGAWPW